MAKSENRDEKQGAQQSRDALLLKLLKTPPQPRPKREPDKSVSPKGKKLNKKSPVK